ncbi:hypothetical protein ABKV19_026159 [Rosa sericea]
MWFCSYLHKSHYRLAWRELGQQLQLLFEERQRQQLGEDLRLLLSWTSTITRGFAIIIIGLLSTKRRRISFGVLLRKARQLQRTEVSGDCEQYLGLEHASVVSGESFYLNPSLSRNQIYCKQLEC